MDESTIIKTEHENKGKSYLCAGMACERICGHRRYISSLDYPALRQGGGATIMYPAASRMGNGTFLFFVGTLLIPGLLRRLVSVPRSCSALFGAGLRG